MLGASLPHPAPWKRDGGPGPPPGIIGWIPARQDPPHHGSRSDLHRPSPGAARTCRTALSRSLRELRADTGHDFRNSRNASVRLLLEAIDVVRIAAPGCRTTIAPSPGRCCGLAVVARARARGRGTGPISRHGRALLQGTGGSVREGTRPDDVRIRDRTVLVQVDRILDRPVGHEYSWPAQAGATSYEVARASSPDFFTACETFTTTATSIVSGTVLLPGEISYHLVRALTPNPGSWGEDSSGVERTICPP